MKLLDKNVRVLDGFTSSKEVWLEVDLKVTQSHHPKFTTIRLSAKDIKELLRRMDFEDSIVPKKPESTVYGYSLKKETSK